MGEPREVRWRTVWAKLRWLGEGGIWGGAWKQLGAPSEIPSKFPPPVARGGYFLGHLPIPLPLNKNKNQDLPPTPFNPSEKKRTKHKKTDTVS